MKIPSALVPGLLLPMFVSSCCVPSRLDPGSGPERVIARRERVEIQKEGRRLDVRLIGFEPFIREMEEDVWCWAACAQMVHAYNGQEKMQRDLVKSIHGTDANDEIRVSTAKRYEILCALNPDLSDQPFELIWQGLRDKLAKSLFAGGDQRLTVDTNELLDIAVNRLWPPKTPSVEDLLAGHPLLVGLRDAADPTQGHVYVCTGISWTPAAGLWGSAVNSGFLSRGVGAGDSGVVPFVKRAIFGRGTLHWLELVDPVDGQTRRVPQAELEGRLSFSISASQARQELLAWRDLVRVKSRRRS